MIAKTGKDNMWTHYASGTKIGSWSRIIMVITGSERAALLHWRLREKVKNQAIFSSQILHKKNLLRTFHFHSVGRKVELNMVLCRTQWA